MSEIQKDFRDIFAAVRARIEAVNNALIAAGQLPAGIDQSRVLVEPPRDAGHGDLATNAAMVLAKDARRKPRELAEAIAERLRADAWVQAVEVAGPGFINLTLEPQVWREALRAVMVAGRKFGRPDNAQARKVNVEYVSANPTGPMHVGHCRGAVFGDALANLLDFAGFAVTREYYINDAGAQVDVLARSAFLRYREALGEAIGPIPEGLYPGDYLKPVGEALAREFGRSLLAQPEEEWLPVVRARAIDMMMAAIRGDLAALNVRHAVFFSERSLTAGDGASDGVAAAITWLRERDLVYEGRLPQPKGAPADDWEDREQTLFRSTAFGDDIDRPLKKSDGSYTYFAADIAYHKTKLDRGYHDLIDVWGADHGGYVKRMQAAVSALSGGTASLDVKLVQLVKLLRAGQPVKMSKRAGEFVTLREVVDEVGRDAVRFMMLFRKNDAALDFDLAKVIEQSRDNPVFYVQYGHARAHSVFRNAADVIPDLPPTDEARARFLAAVPLDRLTDDGEIALMRQIAQFPRLIEAAAAAHEPHRIAFYLYDLASAFHAQWTRGSKDSPYLRFIIQDDREITLARLALVEGIATVLSLGLGLLGVGAPIEMR
ncbi:MAG: arginine--tRNA ligase [Bradyrhizobiaceae bacterium]|nr:arginine--tRNA ligase [Bradyrhizobiaceae bacterium]